MAEHLAHLWYESHGYTVFEPKFNSHKIDFIAYNERTRESKRVQCKSGSRKDISGAYKVELRSSTSGSSCYHKDDFDDLFILTLDGSVYVMAGPDLPLADNSDHLQTSVNVGKGCYRHCYKGNVSTDFNDIFLFRIDKLFNREDVEDVEDVDDKDGSDSSIIGSAPDFQSEGGSSNLSCRSEGFVDGVMSLFKGFIHATI